MSTPRVFIIRHGETEWSLNGRHTGTTDIPLTAFGEKRVKVTGEALIGNEKLIDPSRIVKVYISPRLRAQQTFKLLSLENQLSPDCDIETTNDIREWDYGDYEGLITKDINDLRISKGEIRNGKKWSLWTDGCPGGESCHEIQTRIDRIISTIRTAHHEPVMSSPVGPASGDVVIVAHGDILRAFAARWVGREIDTNPHMLLEAGGVGTLSYEHGKIDEPGILLGGAFVTKAI